MSQPHCAAFCWSPASTWAPNQLEHLPSTSPKAGVASGRSRVQKLLAVDLEVSASKAHGVFSKILSPRHLQSSHPLTRLVLWMEHRALSAQPSVFWRLLWTFWTLRLQPADGRISCDSLGSTRSQMLDRPNERIPGISQSNSQKRDLWTAVVQCSLGLWPLSRPMLHIYLTEIQPPQKKKNLCKIEKIGHLQNQVSTLTCSNLTAFWLHCAVTLSLTQNTHASWLSVPCWLQTPYFWFYPSCFMVVSCEWNLRHFIIFQDCPCFLLCLDALAGHASWSLTWFHPGWRCAAAARYRREIS